MTKPNWLRLGYSGPAKTDFYMYKFGVNRGKLVFMKILVAKGTQTVRAVNSDISPTFRNKIRAAGGKVLKLIRFDGVMVQTARPAVHDASSFVYRTGKQVQSFQFDGVTPYFDSDPNEKCGIGIHGFFDIEHALKSACNIFGDYNLNMNHPKLSETQLRRLSKALR